MNTIHYSTDGKTFEFPSLVDALSVLLDGADEGIHTLYSGKVPTRDILHIDVLDTLNDGAFDKFNDSGFDDPLYDFDLNKYDQLNADLNETVSRAIDQWLDEKGIKPRFSDDMEITKHHIEIMFDGDGMPQWKQIEVPKLHAYIPDQLVICDYEDYRFEVYKAPASDAASSDWQFRASYQTTVSAGAWSGEIHDSAGYSGSVAISWAIELFDNVEVDHETLKQQLADLVKTHQHRMNGGSVKNSPYLPDFNEAMYKLMSRWRAAA